jgi:hypothetical protein
MKAKTLSLSTILGFLGLLIIIHTLNANAAVQKISCQTAYGEKVFTIEEEKVAFHREDELGNSRSISSVGASSVRTHRKNNGFSKSLYIDGNKILINVHDINHFSDVDDYLSVTSPKGHRMTYPLTCSSV